MRTGIFVASYAKDFGYLKGLLKSIKKFCIGFHRVSVAVPPTDKPELLQRFKQWGFENGHNDMNLLIWPQSDEIEYPFMKAQFAMMTMDRSLWDCDVYCMVGSDCLFTAPVTPEHYMPNGKPVMRIDTYESLGNNPTKLWIPGTTKATGYVPKYDYMRSLPLFYNRRMLEVTRQRIEQHTGQPLIKYINAPHKDFSESNIMGICAHKLCPEEVQWVENKSLPMPMNLLQFWSYGEIHRHRMDRAQLYNNAFGQTRNTLGRTAMEVTLDVLQSDY